MNYAAGSATVRFDETRLSLADIRSDVRQIGSKDDAADDGGKEPEEPDAPSAVTQPVAAKAPPSAASADASSPDKDAMKGMKGTP